MTMRWQSLALKRSMLESLNNSGKFVQDYFSKSKIEDNQVAKCMEILLKWSTEVYNDNYVATSGLIGQQILQNPTVETVPPTPAQLRKVFVNNN